ncbi:hypothetical protein SAMN04490356_1608 [Streptomyces melanosporofaciens]|uniref:Uncharacterized protein n=1 Tax=Streptomyces melanosporofaciens TaxID=67327 RepID=A0A1H4M1P6_STRMJ|nr:hypothetical protein SAMN04490356_1608 [Streptomyces melanosporofaciens]
MRGSDFSARADVRCAWLDPATAPFRRWRGPVLWDQLVVVVTVPLSGSVTTWMYSETPEAPKLASPS